MTTTDQIREEVAFLLHTFDQAGVQPVHITAGLYLTAQVDCGAGHAADAVNGVDRIAETLGLPLDDGTSINYHREGAVTIGDRQVTVAIYTGRPDMAEVTA